jgi:hypothetical protein
MRGVDDVLPHENACLDRLAESDFICQQIALNRVRKNAPYSAYLVFDELDCRGGQSRTPAKRCPLMREVAHNAGPRIVEERRLGDSGGQMVRWILDRPRPTHLNL